VGGPAGRAELPAGVRQDWHRIYRQMRAEFTTMVAEDLLAGWKLDELVRAEVLRIT
jgi:hypothetical protein